MTKKQSNLPPPDISQRPAPPQPPPAKTDKMTCVYLKVIKAQSDAIEAAFQLGAMTAMLDQLHPDNGRPKKFDMDGYSFQKIESEWSIANDRLTQSKMHLDDSILEFSRLMRHRSCWPITGAIQQVVEQ